MIYKAKSSYGRRTYELGPDSIAVQGDIPLRGDFQVVSNFADLDPNPEKLRLRGQFMNMGFQFIAAASIAYMIETRALHLDAYHEVCLLTQVVGFTGVFILLTGIKKQWVFRYKTKSGVAVFDLFEAGRMKKEFEPFAAELSRRIKSKESPRP